MKKTLELERPKVAKQSVKKQLIRAIIFLTSANLFIFASVVANLIGWWGVITDDMTLVAWATLIFLSVFIPWSWRATARSMRQPQRY